MRKALANILTSDDYLLHADMWNESKFPSSAKIIDVGLGEANLLNIAGGLASQGKNVYIYGVAGFIIHRLEQLKFSCRYFGANYGKIIICNAGKYGYENLGIGHKLDDDLDIMRMLNIEYFQPNNTKDFKNIIKNISKNQTGIYYIQLGKDE